MQSFDVHILKWVRLSNTLTDFLFSLYPKSWSGYITPRLCSDYQFLNYCELKPWFRFIVVGFVTFIFLHFSCQFNRIFLLYLIIFFLLVFTCRLCTLELRVYMNRWWVSCGYSCYPHGLFWISELNSGLVLTVISVVLDYDLSSQ